MSVLLSGIPVLAALLGAITGGFVVHRLTLRREVASDRRSQRVDYLVTAYRHLIGAANRLGGLSEAQMDDLEAALSDIVLLGESAEVEAARAFMLAMANGNGADLDKVIKSLRVSLRHELGLSAIAMPNPYNLRMERPRDSRRPPGRHR